MTAAEPVQDGDRRAGSSRAADTRLKLRQSIGDVTDLVTSDFALPDFLARVAVSAQRAVPGADGVGVSLYHVDKAAGAVDSVEAIGASNSFVVNIDTVQYAVAHEGPCITAALERRSVRSGSLAGSQVWPRFGPRASQLGCNSALSLPLVVAGQLIGTMNVYAGAEHSFDDQAEQLAESFAAPAAVAVYNATLFAHTSQLAEQLQAALNCRPIIDQAVGIVRGRSGGTADQAFARLRQTSHREQRPLLEVAERIVDNAVGRAAARRITRTGTGQR